ncbi:hypothetical protein [Novacetimonas hansenii]|uniref:Uncharacterized protein n=1 Tax=Novacetimonas hansenii TaxID=436 RepID=A0AAW5EWI7_NOVHA|nr:hypothetical protein [Novacetimonas hansenii]MCJ8355243.1 hypothetical protein [Novacetimonas hansenii]
MERFLVSQGDFAETFDFTGGIFDLMALSYMGSNSSGHGGAAGPDLTRFGQKQM